MHGFLSSLYYVCIRIDRTKDMGRHPVYKFLYVVRYRVFIKLLCFFKDFKIFSVLWPLSVSPRCLYTTHNGRSNTGAAAELAEFRKSTTF